MTGDILNAAARARIKSKNFALPDRRYPIEDEIHARNALARVSQYGSEAEKRTVREKVYKKYPHIKQEHGQSLAQGGEVMDYGEQMPEPEMESTDDHDMLMNHCVSELVDAMHTGDEQMVKEALKVIVRDMICKHFEEMGE